MIPVKKYLTAAAFCVVLASACQKETMVEEPQSSGSITVSVKASTAETKVSFGELSGGRIPVSWAEAGEALNLSEFRNTSRSQDVASSSYSKIDAGSAAFSFTLDLKDAGTFDYVAVYPLAAARTTGTAANKKGRASFALAPTTPQVPTADGPDPAACIMTACDLGHDAQATSLDLQFTHQVAYSKMTVRNFPALEAGETVTSFRISVSSGKVSGRYWYKYDTGECVEYEGSMADYILVNPENIEVNPDSFVLWFATLPVSLQAGEKITVKAETSSGNSYSADAVLSRTLALEKGCVTGYSFNWTKFKNKTLDFDFSTWPAGWPDKLVNGVEYAYGEYTFIHYGYTAGAPSTNRCTHKATTPDFMVLNGLGFLSLPVLENHRLVKVSVTHSASKSTSRRGGIVYGLRTSPDSVEFVTAEPKSSSLWNVAPGTVVELPLLTSCPGHQYWLCCSESGLGISHLQLEYEYDAGPDVSFESDAITVGNLNVWMPSARTSKKEAGTAVAEREWEYARYNVRDLILDSGFDLFGVEEATQRVRNDLQSDLAASGKYSYKFFYHKPSTVANSSSVGLIYNKNRFTLGTTWHFWLSPTPDVEESKWDAESNVRSVGCAVMNDKQTGRSYFVMVAHPSLDDDCNALDGEILLARIKQYNTGNLPVIVVGDMNANWNMPLYRTLSTWCRDARYAVELPESEIWYPGTFNGPEGSMEKLKSRAQRIDYVFLRGCEIYSYRVNRNKFAAGATMQYPSDHCPVVVKCY